MNETDTTRRTTLIVGIAAATTLAVTILVWMLMSQQSGESSALRDLFILTKVSVSMFTAVVLVGVVVTYVKVYRELPNRFTRTLLIMSVSLLLYAIWANPIVWVLFGIEPTGVGLVTVLPDVFTAVAAVMLLQQSGM